MLKAYDIAVIYMAVGLCMVWGVYGDYLKVFLKPLFSL